ncbi:polyprenol monophosphomannose synthase [Cellulomonas bogoriensis]|uniref:Dolichol-phosphate mannosyltransferase n=1 Tax=Cellulomonas bogoriensis 69B4 = DSM 16987 TaxID=1386082 RepID=A0A0A0BN01_9CELL|nr:polyprenol monophosphomannose synthase [Cellulomonas bogoriensis]KGM09265.1 dolichol-phosphate mannosyltransferase [Cellulomonas bogoriensis 69B4 = DSM 16987]
MEHGHDDVSRPRTLVIIPTYDEARTLPVTLDRLRTAVPWVDALVVDDGSPDGTGQIAEDLAQDDPAVHVMHRTGKQGLGTAYVAGFLWALERGYDVVVEMDADGSHKPEQLPLILEALDDGEPGPSLVIGSRWVRGGAVENWPRHREVLSRGGNTYTRLCLGIPVRDATAGFRAYRASALRAIPLTEVASQGYCFQVDMAWRVVRTGGAVREVPITFVERTEGHSKMSRDIVVEALWRVTVWGARHRSQQLRDALRAVTRR